MTIGEYVKCKLIAFKLEDSVIGHNNDFTYVRFGKIKSSKVSDFANFLVEAEVVEIKGNSDNGISCWF